MGIDPDPKDIEIVNQTLRSVQKVNIIDDLSVVFNFKFYLKETIRKLLYALSVTRCGHGRYA